MKYKNQYKNRNYEHPVSSSACEVCADLISDIQDA